MASYHGHTYGTSPADEAFALYIAAKEPGSHQRLSSSASLLSAYSSAIDEESDEDLEANAAAGPSASGSSATLRSNYVAAEALLKPRTSFVSSERTPLLAGPNVLPSADLLPDKEEKLAMVAEEWSILLRYTLPVRGYRLEDTGLTSSADLFDAPCGNKSSLDYCAGRWAHRDNRTSSLDVGQHDSQPDCALLHTRPRSRVRHTLSASVDVCQPTNDLPLRFAHPVHPPHHARPAILHLLERRAHPPRAEAGSGSSGQGGPVFEGALSGTAWL
jgi:hypothetical protein